MKKFCMFCGNKPSNKNKEHILPKWLLAMTGAPNREVSLGRDWNSKNLEVRKYSFSSYTFPACTACNDLYSVMENSVKPVVVSLQTGLPISTNEADLLLDWFDKVRTGLWLASFYLNRNWRGISPGFFINQRVAANDRCLLIYKCIDSFSGLTILGTDTPIFDMMPSVFGMRINGLFIVSVSKDFLLHQELGLPIISKKKFVVGKNGYFAEYVTGSELASEPNIKNDFLPAASAIYQAILKSELRENISGDEFFSSDYCKNMFMEEKYRGKIFISGVDHKFQEFCEGVRCFISPPGYYRNNFLSAELSFCIANLQRKLFIDNYTFDGIAGEDKEFYLNQVNSAVKIHDLITDAFKKAVLEYL